MGALTNFSTEIFHLQLKSEELLGIEHLSISSGGRYQMFHSQNISQTLSFFNTPLSLLDSYCPTSTSINVYRTSHTAKSVNDTPLFFFFAWRFQIYWREDIIKSLDIPLAKYC